MCGSAVLAVVLLMLTGDALLHEAVDVSVLNHNLYSSVTQTKWSIGII